MRRRAALHGALLIVVGCSFHGPATSDGGATSDVQAVDGVVIDGAVADVVVPDGVGGPQPLLWLPFDSSLVDRGTGGAGHAVSTQRFNSTYDGAFSSMVANSTCGSASLSLPGDGSYVQVTSAGDLDVDTGHPFSITAWIKTSTPGGVIAAKSPSVTSSSTHTPALYVNEAGALRFDVFFVATVVSTTLVATGQWTHVAVTYDGTTYRLYIDGAFAAMNAFGGGNEGANGEGPWSFTVGATLNKSFPPNAGNGGAFHGNLDEVAMWGSALSPSQIATIFANGVP